MRSTRDARVFGAVGWFGVALGLVFSRWSDGERLLVRVMAIRRHTVGDFRLMGGVSGSVVRAR